jgi:hypothetical protein
MAQFIKKTFTVCKATAVNFDADFMPRFGESVNFTGGCTERKGSKALRAVGVTFDRVKVEEIGTVTYRLSIAEFMKYADVVSDEDTDEDTDED